MTEEGDRIDKLAAGSGAAPGERAEDDDMRPGVTGGGTQYLPDSGGDAGASADRAEGTVGAVGEMDLTGAPAGPGGDTGSGESVGGGPGGGAMSR